MFWFGLISLVSGDFGRAAEPSASVCPFGWYCQAWKGNLVLDFTKGLSLNVASNIKWI